MDVAQLMLEYIKVLAWPTVVAGVLVAFRGQIGGKIASLTRVSTPIGDADFERDAKEVEELADRAAARQDRHLQPASESIADSAAGGAFSAAESTTRSSSAPDTTPVDPDIATTGRSRREDESAIALRDRQMAALLVAINALASPPDFGVARSVSMQSPSAAVMLAYTEVEKVGRAAMTVTEVERPAARENLTRIVSELTRTGLEVEFVQVARELAELRNRVTHGGGVDEISRNGALDFIAACERLAEAIIGNATSKLRHPSRQGAIRELQVLMKSWKRPESSGDGHDGSEDRE